jgi:hypothetical protein
MIWMDALAELDSLGYVLSVDGEKIRYAYQGGGNPNPAQIIPLFEAIKAHKAGVVEHLKKHTGFERMFKQALEEINSKYISGAIPYMRGTHPHLWRRLVEMEDKLSEAWLAGIADEFKRNLDEWININLKAIENFQDRDAQGGLFAHGEIKPAP